jgi:hypothetical protein
MQYNIELIFADISIIEYWFFRMLNILFPELHPLLVYHTLQPAIWTTDAIGNSDHIYVTRNDR